MVLSGKSSWVVGNSLYLSPPSQNLSGRVRLDNAVVPYIYFSSSSGYIFLELPAS